MRTAVVTYADAGVAGWAEISLPNKRRYCKARGYSFFVHDSPYDPDVAPVWQKIQCILQHLDDFELVFWSDADALVMNFDVRLERIVGEEFDLVVGSDCRGINFGNALVRRSSSTKRLLSGIWEDRHIAYPFLEQGALTAHIDRHFAFEPRFRVARQDVMNSYPDLDYYRDSSTTGPNLETYKEGHFIIHFAGLWDRADDSRRERFRRFDKLAGHFGDASTPPPGDVRPVTLRTCWGRIKRALAGLPDKPSTDCSGKGIVVSGHGDLFASAWICLRMLREHGCELPIQFWHLGEEGLSSQFLELVSRYGIECIDALRIRAALGGRILRGAELRAFAICNSRFTEVLYLDSNSVPLGDPSFLFDCDLYKEHGVLLWPDSERTDPESAIWDFIPFREEHRIDSAQLLVDKGRHWRPVAFLQWVNENSDFFGRFFAVDSDGLTFSFHLLRVHFEMVRRPPDILRSDGYNLGTARGQHGPDGKRILQQRDPRNWQLYGPNPRVIGFRSEERCLRLLEELRNQLPGEISPIAKPNGANSSKRPADVSFPVTICVIAYGPHADLAEKFLNQLYENTDPALFRLRFGLNEAEPRTHALVEKAVDKFGNIDVFVESINIFKNPLMRRLFYERPLGSKWTIWFDDDCFPTRPDWLEWLAIRIKEKPDIAQWGWMRYAQYGDSNGIIDFMARSYWNKGLPLPRTQGATQDTFNRIDFAAGGFWALRTDVIKKLNWPDPRIVQYAEDVMLGEALRQNGFKMGAFTYGYEIGDTPRRNSNAEEICGLPRG